MKKNSSSSPNDSSGSPKLQPTSLWELILCALLLGGAGFFFAKIWIRAGQVPLFVPRWTFLMPFLIGIFVLWQGWMVRTYRHGKRALSPLQAGRIWLLSQAASRTGALLGGAAAGILFCYLNISGNAFLTQQIWNFLLVVIASVFLTIAGWVVERWCIVEDKDDDSHSPGAPLVEPA